MPGEDIGGNSKNFTQSAFLSGHFAPTSSSRRYRSSKSSERRASIRLASHRFPLTLGIAILSYPVVR